MADYKFDGKYLKDKYNNNIAVIDGKSIKDSQYNRVGEIDGERIKDSHYKIIAEIYGNDINDAGHNRIGTLDEIHKIIDGPRGVSLAALWALLIRK
jgi:hypothetical protein